MTLHSPLSKVAAFCMLMGSNAVMAQISMVTTGSHTENFNTLSSTTGTGVAWTDNSTLANWYWQAELPAGLSSGYSVGTGSSTSPNGRWSFGTASNSDRAMGSLVQNACGHISRGVRLRNQSGTTISSITLAYTGEQWRDNVAAAQTLTVWYKVSSSAFTALEPGVGSGWTQVPALTFTSPQIGNTGGNNQGNNATWRTVFSATALPSISVPDGHWLMIKWDDINDAGLDHFLAIDDVTIAWTVPCSAPTLDAKFNGSDAPAICAGTSASLSANPSGGANCSGTFQYAWYTGDGTGNTYWDGTDWDNAENFGAFATVTGVAPSVTTTYRVKTRCSTAFSCNASDATGVTVTVDPVPSTASAGADQQQCNDGAFILAGNDPGVGTGAWSVTSGSATIANTALFNAAVTAVPAGGSATLRWTISSGACTPSTDDVILYNTLAPTLDARFNALDAPTICAGSSADLTANPSGGGGCSGTFEYAWYTGDGTGNTYWDGTDWDNAENFGAFATIVGVAPSSTETYKVKVRCSTLTSCAGEDATGVTVTVNDPPSTADAGDDQSGCGTSSFTLAGNDPGVGTGEWSVISGTATITDELLFNSEVTGVPSGTSATLRWTISNPGCASSTDDVVLTNSAPPTLDARFDGADAPTICAGANGTLSANPTGGACSGTFVFAWYTGDGTGNTYWDGTDWDNAENFGAFGTIASVAPSATETYKVKVRCSTDVGCASGDATGVTVTVNDPPSVADAGVDQSGCGASSFTLDGNDPSVGTGVWSVISGTATITDELLFNSEVTGVPSGTSATLRWTISNPGCTSSSDDVVLTNSAAPTLDARFDGADAPTICVGTNGTLSADPTGGACSGTFEYAWYTGDGTGNTYWDGTDWDNAENFGAFGTIASVAPSATETYKVKVRCSTDVGCASGDATGVTVTVNDPPTTANAGSDIVQCNTGSFTLAGNAPSVGTGSWTVFAGTAIITENTLFNSGVTGVPAGTTATLRWTISNAPCAASFDDVVLRNTTVPTLDAKFNALDAPTICAGSSASLTANPTGGGACAGTFEYAWYTGDGTGNTYWDGTDWDNAENWGAFATVTGVEPAGTTTYKVKVRCSTLTSCINEDATGVTVTVNAAPSTATAGTDIEQCGSGSFTLAGNDPTVGTGLWTLISGTAAITTPGQFNSGVTGVPVGTSATLRWTISNAPCTASFDEVVLTHNSVPNISAGPVDAFLCGTTGTVQFTVTATGTGISRAWEESTDNGGSWNPVSNGGVYSGATTATLTITNPPGSMNGYQYRAVISGTCTPPATSAPAVLSVYTTDCPDDFRTRENVTGNWNGTTTWQRFNGTSWVDWTGAQPTSTNGKITLRSGSTVTITANLTMDQVLVEDGAVLIYSSTSASTIANGPGTDVQVLGRVRHTSSSTSSPFSLNASATLEFGSTGIYVHEISVAAGTVPNGAGVTWNASSTLRINNPAGTGVVTGLGSQTLGNVEFLGSTGCAMSNSLAQTQTIQGNLIMNTSGNVILNNNSGDATVTVNGFYEQVGSGSFTIHSNNTSFSLTKTLTIVGDFRLSAGTFNLSSNPNTGVSANSVITNLDVRGDFTHTGGVLTETATDVDCVTRVRLVRTTATQNLESTGQGGTLDFTVATANAQCVVAATKSFTLSSGTRFTIGNGTANPDLLINGTFLNQPSTSMTSSGNWRVANGGTFIHNTTSGIGTPLNSATFEAASTFIYRGSSSLTPSASFANRTYGNLRFESTSGTYTTNFQSGANPLTVAGTLRVGDGTNPVTLTQGSFTGTLNFDGNILIDAGSSLTCRSFTLGSANTLTMVNPAAFSLAASAASQTFTLNGTVLVYNTNGFNAATTHAISNANTPTITLAANSTVRFIGAAAQSAAGLPATVGNLEVDNAAGVTLGSSSAVQGNVSVLNGTLDLGTHTLDRASPGGVLSLASGSALRVGGTNSFPADYGTYTLNEGSTTEYYGADQLVRGLIYGDLVLSGTGSKTLDNTANITAQDLTLNTGTTMVMVNERSLTLLGTQVTLAGGVTANRGVMELFGFEPMTLSITDTKTLFDLITSTDVTVTGSLGIRGTLELVDGEFDASGAEVTLRSFSNGTGRLGPVGATADYVGALTMQRRIPPGVTNWRLLGSAVQGRSVVDWNDDFVTAGFPGSDFPNFDNPVGSGILWPSVRWYNETVPSASANTGLVGVSNINQLLTPGQGFAVWCGTSNTTSAFMIDVTGAPTIAKTPFTLPMSYTDSGNPLADGWNLVSNPLPSPVLFSAISKGADVENGYYIYDPVAGSNAYWDGVDGESFPANVLNGVIQASQAFWLKANGAAVSTSVQESHKTSGDAGGLFGGNNGALRPSLRLTVQGGAAWKDETTVRFDQGVPGLDARDVLKLDFSHPDAPRIASRSTEGHDLMVNRFGAFDADIAIPLAVRVPANGTYTLRVDLTGLNFLSCFMLEDLVAGTLTPVTDGSVYSFTMNTTAQPVANRFVLRATRPLPFQTQDALCGGTATASIAVQVPAGPQQLTLGDAFGSPLQQVTVPAGTHVFEGLTAGSYTLGAATATACGTLSAPIVLLEPFPLSTEVLVQTATSCPDSGDGQVELVVLGGEAPYALQWSNGSTGTSVAGAAGNYTALITDAAGCTLEAVVTIPAGAGPVALFEVPVEPMLVGQPVSFTNLGDPAATHTWDLGDGTVVEGFSVEHTYVLPGVYTVTLTVNDGLCSSSVSLDVVVQVSTGEATQGGGAAQHAWYNGAHVVVEHGFTHGAPVFVQVLDATGRLVQQLGTAGNGEPLFLPGRDLSTGIWFVRILSQGKERTLRVPVVR